MAIKGGGQLSPSVMVFSMKGSFHLELLVAAGETLCPFKRTMVESSGCTIVAPSGTGRERAGVGVPA